MKRFIPIIVAAGCIGAGQVLAFDSGSTGSYGSIHVVSGQVENITLPADGVVHATTITVDNGGTLKFVKNDLNTPAYLLATGDVVVAGVVDISGGAGTTTTGGEGGPGGMDGGKPGASGIPAGAGIGPGAGTTVGLTRNAGYGRAGIDSDPSNGQPYGSALLVPLVGGSGGGGFDGNPGIGGGGGGGAVLIASSTRITVDGVVNARGGRGSGNQWGGGSGGAIRLLASAVDGTGTLDAGSGSTRGGPGRLRIDTLDAPGAGGLQGSPSAVLSIGTFLVPFLDPEPRLDITEVAGQAVAEGTTEPVVVVLPFGSDTNQTITVQARDFQGLVPIDVVLTPEIGDPIVVSTQIDMAASNPASATVTAGFPINQSVAVSAWTR